MNEYIFFDEALRACFLEQLAALHVSATTRADEIEGLVVAVSEGLGEQIESAIENAYESLMEEQHALTESNDAGARALMAIAITLPDGEPRTIRVPAQIARRLFEYFGAEEVQEIVAAIAHSAWNPVEGPLCRRE